MAKIIGTFLKYTLVPPRKRNKVISLSLFVLLIFSSIMVVSATMSTSGASIGSTFSEIMKSLKNMGVIKETFKQCAILLVGYIGYCVCSNMYSMKFMEKTNIILVSITIIALIWATFFTNSTVSKCWIRLGPISIQPSEFAKVVIVLLIAYYLCDKKGNIEKSAWSYLRIPVLFYFSTIFIVLFLQNDLGSAFAFAGIGALCFLIINNQKYKRAQLILLIFISVVFVIAILLMIPEVVNTLYDHNILRYQLARFKNVLDPTWDKHGYSRELLNSLIAIMKGNVFGVGIGNSVLKFGYIASSSADYIFAIIVEETGIIGVSIVFGCYLLILAPLMYYALKAKKVADKCILVGMISYLFIHMFLNIGGISGLIPSTGVPLLLVSAGGSSCVSTMCLLGISQRVIANIGKGE